MRNPLFYLILLLVGNLAMQNVSAATWWEMTPEEVRNRINQRIMEIEAPTPDVQFVEDRLIKCDDRNTSIRIYTPMAQSSFPIILLIHGGAWVAGNLDTHDDLARYLCSETQALVVSVGYLNAPEGKFPVPLEQSYDVLNWVSKHAEEFAADASRIAVLGDSAGGNMSAALCLMARDRQGPKIQMQVLINPAPDLTCRNIFERQNDDLDLLRWQAIQYLSDLNQASHPYVSPLVANDLSGLPPAVVLLAEKDDLRADGQKYADRLIAAHVPTIIYCQQDVGHLAGHGARASIQARESLTVAVAVLRNLFFNGFFGS